MAWQDDKSWSEIDQIEQKSKDDQEYREKHGGDPGSIKIPIYSSDSDKTSVWSILKKWFSRDK